MTLVSDLQRQGYAQCTAKDCPWLPSPASDPDWADFAGSWDRLGLDRYMADGGRYRRRRHATLAVRDGVLRLKPRQPHFQSRDYNPLNGDIQRWFEPVETATLHLPLLCTMLLGATSCFETAHGIAVPEWHLELHQFRIEANEEASGLPTPEGMHRDGVDWVLVMLIDRTNVREGVTEIRAASEGQDDRFILRHAGDTVLLDDRRVLHGVTPILPIDPARPAYRDALVATWVADPALHRLASVASDGDARRPNVQE